jgi:hypothetical protein
MSDLCALAARYVELETEIAGVRRSMLAALTNGGAGEPTSRPTPRRVQAPGAKPPSREEMMARAAARNRIVDILKAQRGQMGLMAIARATDSNRGTTSERLKRLQTQNLVEQSEDGGWRAIAS